VLHRHDLTDAEWAQLDPLLPDRTPARGGRWAVGGGPIIGW
jgi:transposase